MKITKSQLKRIIKEELEAVMAGAESFPGDGETPVLSPEELGLEGVGMIAEVGLGTITLGVVLGLAAWKAAGIVGSAAKSILGVGLRRAQHAVEAKMEELEAQAWAKDKETAQEIIDQIGAVLDGDPQLDALAAEYHKLTDQVMNTPKKGGIKGLRGTEYADIRKRQKEVAYQFAEAVKAAVSSAIQDVAPDTELPRSMSRDVVDLARKYGRRRR
jgi:hypothetical protein